MKLTAPEAKAVKFVLLLIALSALARWLNRSEPAAIEQSLHSAPESPRPAHNQSTPGPLDPNTATLSELDRLPGVGPATAKRIVAARPLRNLEDLAQVVGPKRAAQLASRLTLPATTTNVTLHASQVTSAAASRISLNRATSAELERLSGVGPALAQRLIAARDSLQGFRVWSQVDAVQGIGPSMLKMLKEKASL